MKHGGYFGRQLEWQKAFDCFPQYQVLILIYLAREEVCVTDYAYYN